ncbi:polyprenyl synthetase family protein [Alkalihalobacillus sp. AL-G]|uniref:polyprenyl synthetase family protein n=1 Tax=Alkalihalobacillus sp. AL-G TaxID=2926399 RepID=UPI00272C53A5|nr:farnesyl diphosphate synthase [Alkalihalobacillus sp. AL-G]WLD91987.1 polyprenyl synthetase family protein [Alkalihalobacillus sp. AL-G]
MNKDTFLELLQRKKQEIDEALPAKIEGIDAHSGLKEAMLYSILAGGKRLRPILFFRTIEALGKDSQPYMDIGCAIEMIHTYSLIHDDLPAMDDDDFRRGNLTNHKVYGEALAILAGDGLLTFAFQTIADSKTIESNVKVDLISKLATAAGPEGMIDGQAADLDAEDKKIAIDELEQIHRNKTGALLGFSIYGGAKVAGGSQQQLVHLTHFANHLGLAFQIQDDILDIEGDEGIIGKPVGSDQQNKKSTYPQLLTLEGAKKKLSQEVDNAKEHLYKAGIDHTWLVSFTDYMVSRDH